MSERMVAIPLALLADRRLGKTAKVVAMALSELASRHGPAIDTENAIIAEIASINIRDVQEGLHRLEQSGWILRLPQVRGERFRSIQILWFNGEARDS